jgi:DNA gyrase/topoisomerase IV subunit B
MNADQLWETTMNPEHRSMLQVTLEDAIDADQTFEMFLIEVIQPSRDPPSKVQFIVLRNLGWHRLRYLQ